MKQAILEIVRHNKRMLIAAGVILVLNIGLYVTASGYLEPKIAASQASWNELRQRLAVMGRSDVATVHSRGVEDLKKLEARIPVKRQFPRVLGEILDAAASSAVITGSVSYKPQIIKDQGLLAYGLSMSVGGSYAAVKSFLGDIQNNHEMVVIDSVNLSKSDLYEENVVMDLRLTIYLQAKEEGV